jgi:hypothetical protein
MAPHQRRWGRRIAYKGRFHDAVRSQTGHVVTVLWDPLGVPDAPGVCALVSARLRLAGAQRSHADSRDQRQTRQTTSHNDTCCTAPDLACETLGFQARDRIGWRRRFCLEQPGSYVPPLASPLCLTFALDRTTLRSCATTVQRQAGSQAQERSPPAEVDRSRVKDKATAWLRQEITCYAGQGFAPWSSPAQQK